MGTAQHNMVSTCTVDYTLRTMYHFENQRFKFFFEVYKSKQNVSTYAFLIFLICHHLTFHCVNESKLKIIAHTYIENTYYFSYR